jgi:hypothetical protein
VAPASVGTARKEAELRRRAPLHTKCHRPQYRRAGAADAGDHGDALHQADEQRILRADIRDAARMFRLREPLDNQNRNAADDERPRHHRRIFQQRLDRVVEGEADHHRRNERQQQVDDERDRAALRLDEAEQHRPEGAPVEHENREDRARLDRDIEQRPFLGIEPHQLGREDEVAGRGDGEILRHPLDNAQHNGRHYV